MNPLYENPWVKLYHGDCLEVMPQLNVRFDVCITDPPYGTTACKWDSVIPFKSMWENLDRLVKENGVVCLFGSEPFSSALRMSNLEMFRYDWIWDKKHGVNFAQAPYMPLKNYEVISVFSHGTIAQNSKNRMIYNPQGVVECNKICPGKPDNEHRPKRKTQENYIQTKTNYPNSFLVFNYASGFHPTQKPVALIEYLIKTYTNENELILDFTAGSGTTGVAAMETNRKAILIEMEEKYCEITVKRLQDKEKEIAERLF